MTLVPGQELDGGDYSQAAEWKMQDTVAHKDRHDALGKFLNVMEASNKASEIDVKLC